MSIDPYHQWLGIPPEQQPPDCYQLLGVRRFEHNPTVISNAAERQLLMLKSLQAGPHASVTQKLMREVNAARIRLLDPEKKAQYDVELRKRLSAGSTPPPVPKPDGAERAERPAIEEPASVAPRKKREPTNRARKSPQNGSARTRLGWRTGIIATSVVAVSLLMIVVWVSRTEVSSRVATKQESQPGRAQAKQGVPRPSVPPWVKLQRDEMQRAKSSKTSELVQESLDPLNTDKELDGAIPATDGNDGNVADNQEEPTDTSAISNGEAREATDEETSPIDETEGAETTEASAFELLPGQLNVRGTVDATGTGYVFVGKLAAPAQSSWTVDLEDYGVPSGETRFLVGDGATDDEGMHWPFFRSVTSANDATAETSPSEVLARIDAGPTDLSLWLANPKNSKLIDHLSRCGLVVANEDSRHHVQLGVHHHIPPVVLSLDKTVERITFEGVPGIDELASARLQLEILHVDHPAGQAAAGLGLQAGYGQQLTVTLDTDLQCELGIVLTTSDEQLGMTVMPRYLHNERKEAMAPSKLTREIARSKSQLTRNQRDFVEAQNALRVLPGQISRVRGMTVRTPPEHAARQSRLSQLVGMHGSAQSRVQRLSQVIPELTASIKRMEKVLDYSKDLPDQVKLHLRVFARGELGDYLVLVAADADFDPAGTGNPSE